jgi:catechol 2,3-dioxygenase-like lactoylglutathione lyase family enzyme
LILALWPREELARDAGLRRPAPAGREAIEVPQAAAQAAREIPGVALAYNTRSEAEVAEVLAMAEKAGGRILKPAARAFWGGVQGYFYDTEGNLWEVAHNPDFPLDAEGRISLPE